LGSSFRKQLSGATLAAWGSSCSEQLPIIILGAALGNSFVEQVWGVALGSRSKFEEQLCVATSKSSFEEPQLWELALK